MLPLAVLLSVELDAGPVLTPLTMVVGVVAALVQGLRPGALAIQRCPSWLGAMSPPPDPTEGEATRRTVEVAFAVLHRYLGVGMGEHLGYLVTGWWTLLVAARSWGRSCRGGSPSSASSSGSRC